MDDVILTLDHFQAPPIHMSIIPGANDVKAGHAQLSFSHPGPAHHPSAVKPSPAGEGCVTTVHSLGRACRP